jgi:hypothetical protein
MHPYNVGFISNALGFKLIGVIFSEMWANIGRGLTLTIYQLQSSWYMGL